MGSIAVGWVRRRGAGGGGVRGGWEPWHCFCSFDKCLCLLVFVLALVVLKMRNEETDSDRGRDLSPSFSHILAAKKIEVMRPDRLVTRGTTNSEAKKK